jgi:O-antigen biosynthesis protein WbqP
LKREQRDRTTEAPDGKDAVQAKDVHESVGKRLFDGFLALVLLTVLGLPMLLIGVTVRATSRGPALYWSGRVGRDNRVFRMPKFRTMQVDAPIVATHLLSDPAQHLTPIGGFLRKSSIDELPQLMSILIGHMSFVGPRAALFNQEDLVELRTQRGIHRITPGLTGWAQINGRDELPIPAKVDLDEHYLRHRSFLLDLRIIVRTGLHVVRRDGVAH